MQSDPRHGKEYTALLAQVSQVLHDHDPAQCGPDAPEGEYDAEAAQILSQAKRASTVDELSVIIANVLCKSFDEWTASHSLGDSGLALAVWAALHASGR